MSSEYISIAEIRRSNQALNNKESIDFEERPDKYKCLGISLKFWLSKKKFWWLPRLGQKWQMTGAKHYSRMKPYGAYYIGWLWFDIVFYYPVFFKRKIRR